MRENTILLVAAVAGSALLWWPVTIEPNLNLPLWLPLAFIALVTGLVAALSGGRWLRFVFASAVGTFVGLCCGYAIWPSADPIVDHMCRHRRRGHAGCCSSFARRGSSRAEGIGVEPEPATCRMACIVMLCWMRAGRSGPDSTTRRISGRAQ
jgi:hypothetical protein